jgi:outer membrane receptor for ferrienterochelin and colicin
MKQCRVSAFARAARLIALAAVALALGASTLLAQSTGKIEGRVRDQAGAPIANAQVFVVGTAFNAITNPQGYYFINSVPAGTISVRAAFIGYKATQVDGVKVLADQTGTVDIQLEQTTVELEEITVVSATQPLVPRDEVTTKQRVDGDFAAALPADNLNQVLQLQPGVLQDTDGGLSIRGARETQNATYVDGVPTQAGYRGDTFVGSAGTSLSLNTNSFEEASVTTGSTSAEYGNATGGVISVVTRTGGPEYTGSLSFETDEPMGANHGVGFNRIEGGFSGPLANRLTFAVSGLLQGQRAVEEGLNSQDTPIFLPVGLDTTVRQLSVLDDPATADVDERIGADTTLVPVYNYAISRGQCDEFDDAGSADTDDEYVQQIRNNFGVDCNGVRLPATARTTHSLNGKLNYTYGTGSRVSLSVATSRFHGHSQPFIIGYINNLSSGMLRGFSNRNRLATLNWTQNLSKSAERALALDVALSYQQDRTINGPLTTQSDLDTRDPFGGFILGGMDFDFNFDNFPITDGLIDNVRRNSGRITPIDENNGSAYLGIDALRNNAYGLYGQYQNFANASLDLLSWGFLESGRFTNDQTTPTRVSLFKENRYIGKATLDWQVDRYNRVRTGGELTRYSIDQYSFRMTDKFFSDAYREKPIRWNAFIEDRLDLGDVVVVGGLRYDWYDSRASRPYVTNPETGERYAFPRISSSPEFDLNNPTAQYVRDESHSYLSPHVQVSFPVTDRTNFRLSYSHQVQAPDFGLVLTGINTDLNNTNTNQVYGTDLDFGKTIAFEFGIRHAFSDDMVLDLAAYNKDIVADPAARLVSMYDPAANRLNDFRILTNLDFGNVRGLDVRLDRRFGNYFNGTIAYAYQQAKNTGSDPFTYINYGSRIVNQVGGINGAQPPPQGILPTDDSRPHALTGAFSITLPGDFRQGSVLGNILRNVSVFSTFRYTSGTAYTKCGESNEETSVLSIENCVRLFPEGLNTQRLPAFKELNTRFTKSFGLGGLDVTGYLDVRNLLNFRNVLQVFAVNGDTRNDVERADNMAADIGDLATEGTANGVRSANGDIDLTFGGAADRRTGCSNWVSSKGGAPAAANCVYLIRAEQRYGDGDGLYTVEEQENSINALYDVARGEQQHLGLGRRARLGFEINF